jgi:hypothetical protein
MLNLRAGALAALACRGRERHPPDVADRFLAACVAKLPSEQERLRDAFAESCRCMLDRVLVKFSFAEFSVPEGC